MTILFICVAALVLLFGFVVAVGAPYVPSLHKEVKAAFRELYHVDKQDVVVDLGSGDGSVLVAASIQGARCFGVELNPLLVLISRLRLGRKATIELGNMWQVTLPSNTTLVYAFVVSRDVKKLERLMMREAQRLGKELHLMTFGAALPTTEPVKIRNAHSLYSFKPLQAD